MASFDVDKLTYDIFSILENKFLFGYDQPKQQLLPPPPLSNAAAGKVRILSIDGAGSTDGLLAAASLARLQAFIRRKSGNPDAHISDYFDVVAGSGAGAILAALLFTRGKDGLPLFTADEALNFMVENRRKIFRPPGILRRIVRSSKVEKLLRKTFGESTLRDTIKPVLVPCYDLSTCAPLLFSRADALEMDSFDFKMRDVCLATLSDPTVMGAVEVRSVDQKTKIVAVDGSVTMNNPTAAAITHVLNNKLEFPFCNGVGHLLVVSLGNGESDFGVGKPSLPSRFLRIASDGASDMVDQAVSMAFGELRTSNYVRIQTNGTTLPKSTSNKDIISGVIEETMLSQKNYECVLFKGRKMVESSIVEKLETFAGELIKEEEKRKTSIMPTVLLKQAATAAFPTPRTSSATTLSTFSSS